MDRPVPDGVKVHQVKFSFMGVMFPVYSYKSGDWIDYGGMMYKPGHIDENGNLIMIHTAGDPDSSHSWGGGSGTRHTAKLYNACKTAQDRTGNKPMFWCS